MSLAVVTPWFAGIASGRASDGLVASFGAYLLTVSFPSLPASGRWMVLIAGAVVFSLFATAGAFVPLVSVIFLIAALVAALAQSFGELSGGYFRLPLSLSALAFFLSVGQVPADGALHYGVNFLAGTLWASVFVGLAIPATRETASVNKVNLVKSRPQMRFATSIVGVSLAGGLLAGFIPGSHPCWLPAAGLRVMKPTRSQTIYRMKSRGAGTVLGAAAGGIALGLAPVAWLHASLVFVLLLLMLSVGAKKYGSWSFCLTAIALAFNLHPGTSILGMAGSRVLLTIGGILLAALMLLLLPKKQSS